MEEDVMNIDDYEIVKRVCISNKKELMEFAEKYSDKHIFSYKENDGFEIKLSDGIDIRIGRYSRVVEEFRDPFDFPYGFFKEQIFIPRNDGELCLEFIFPKIRRYENQKHIVTLSDILRFMKENNSILRDDISIISVDTDFELKGSLTHEMYLDIFKKKDTGEEYIIAAMYV